MTADNVSTSHRRPRAEARSRRSGATTVVIPAHVVGPESSTAYGKAVKQFGQLDAGVHCAVMDYGRFDEMPARVFDQMLWVKLFSTANVARSSL